VVGKFVAAGLELLCLDLVLQELQRCTASAWARCRWWPNKEEADRVLSQLKIVIRTNYSNPPTHGGAVVAAVLGNPELRALWEKELGEMRVRIKAMRQKLVDGLKAAGVQQDMSFITTRSACSATRACPRTRWCACAASSACTAPTPAACAWPR
jgi:aromatic-amino-acid transaminase